MTVQNRTNEFRAAVETFRNRGEGAMAASELAQRLEMKDSDQLLARQNTHENRSDFARMAAQVGRQIATTAAKLEQLTKLAKKKSLFDDRPGADMEQLTQTVKQDITDINQQIQDLDSYLIQKGARVGNGQTQAHSKTIVTALQSRLATTSNAFKDILEVRTQNLKAQHERRSQFGSSALAPSQFSDSPLYYPQASSSQANSGGGDGFISISMPQQQLMQESQNNALAQDRAVAIEGIEKTIGELAGMFQQLTEMISQHDDYVQRIDANIYDVESNVVGAQNQLLQYYNNISSNRGLMIKMFLTMIIFFLVFVLFFA